MIDPMTISQNGTEIFGITSKSQAPDDKGTGTNLRINTDKREPKNYEVRPVDGEKAISKDRVNTDRRTNEGKTEALIFRSYLSTIASQLNAMREGMDFSYTSTGKLTSLTQNYLDTLSSQAAFRIYLSSMLMIIRNNYESFDKTNISGLLEAVEKLRLSPYDLKAVKKNLQNIYDLGLKPIKTSDE